MKTLKNLVGLVSIVIIVAGCGGAENSVTSTSNTTTNNEITPTATTDSHELIIHNGRGTSNNQDTERSDKNLSGSH
ncbi:MAG TPA: hypothetical protein EYH16_01075 [Leucothrix mucor]|nr:hypothetical protein [Leucothrix mucor]